MRKNKTLDDIISHVDGMFPALKEDHSRQEVLDNQKLRDGLEKSITNATKIIASFYFDLEKEVSIKISGRLKKAMANVRAKDNFIKYNPKLFSLDYKEIIGTIAHELVHAELERGDNDAYFQSTCELAGIPLHAETIGVDNYWVLTCPNHGVVARRTRKSKVIKQADRYHCSQCGESLTAEKRDET